MSKTTVFWMTDKHICNWKVHNKLGNCFDQKNCIQDTRFQDDNFFIFITKRYQKQTALPAQTIGKLSLQKCAQNWIVRGSHFENSNKFHCHGNTYCAAMEFGSRLVKYAWKLTIFRIHENNGEMEDKLLKLLHKPSKFFHIFYQPNRGLLQSTHRMQKITWKIESVDKNELLARSGIPKKESSSNLTSVKQIAERMRNGGFGDNNWMPVGIIPNVCIFKLCSLFVTTECWWRTENVLTDLFLRMKYI